MSVSDHKPARPVPRHRPRGRHSDPQAQATLNLLLGEAPLQRDRLLEYLHAIQDRFGAISKSQLYTLASRLGISQAEVWDVASFYAHFDLVEDRHLPEQKPLKVRVCTNPSCALAGAESLWKALGDRPQPGVQFERSPCMGLCTTAPAVQVGHHSLPSARVDSVQAAIDARDDHARLPPALYLEGYRASGGYRLLERCRNREMSAQQVMDELERAGLRGLGGAGFPAARKWQTVRQQPSPRYLVINADEGEPGTCKDRHYLESDPHRMLEGALIAAWVIDAERCYLYLRDEYPAIRLLLQQEISALEQAELIAPGYIELRRGAGAYICGEESALIESLEGKRGFPRQRPPFVAERGLFNRPTLVNNVETLYRVREILEHGGQWFSDLGRRGQQGLLSFSVSGRVQSPGVKQAPAGITLNELVEEHCGGMLPGHRLLAYLPGGASGGILPARLADLPLGFGTLQAHGCFIGSAAVLVLSDQDDLRALVCNLAHFFREESCGQCSPCRLGTDRLLRLVAQSRWDSALIEELGELMLDSSICGLGQAACNPALSLIRYFPELLATQGGAQ
ncbi:NAD(P)H-dependent oxidoreductase subunit E [Aestuariirhabdus litorea]|uniref:NADH-quinone oxidoreductase subunit F n=1 Tax=Aestuariirhabdus litorea TaxID=2528527 RepID=A0A3P3VIW6_9GAMM|nr:NAD(P)H-dependent oxidoreductase subunit E [Aestuariirhabdus litorea]RRJ82691.1 NADH-quinone oxidoreductase subunit F [Aestuariirhabdus litorea]RWW92851.1 NADH-quinone oxidoreductase subunit F [Endozoicomonadaceae bacterium GTF-13]